MQKMPEHVRRLVGLENLLQKARRRSHECEREEGRPGGPRGIRYFELVARLKEEILSVDKGQLEDYLRHVEKVLIPHIDEKAQAVIERMGEKAREIVDLRLELHDLRGEYTDSLERSRHLRERLGLEPIRPIQVHFGVGPHPPNADRPTKQAHDLVKDVLKG